MTTDDLPLIPDVPWLEARFGEGSLWRPAAADLPAELEDQASREFLTTVGFPAVKIDLIEFDSVFLKDDGLYPDDADELYGRRYPDDDSPPRNFCFTVGTCWDQQLMLNATLGAIDHYDPNGWDHGEGYKGTAATSLASLAVLLGLLIERREALEADDKETRSAASADLLELMLAYDAETDDSSFWEETFEYL